MPRFKMLKSGGIGQQIDRLAGSLKPSLMRLAFLSVRPATSNKCYIFCLDLYQSFDRYYRSELNRLQDDRGDRSSGTFGYLWLPRSPNNRIQNPDISDLQVILSRSIPILLVSMKRFSW